MTDLSKDPIVNAIYKGIKGGIRVALENECYGSAVVLILSGIDAMAYLSMPAGQQDVTRNDFVAWVDKYIHFPCREQLTGWDLYGARCGMLHNFSTISKLSRDGQCRQVGYMDRSIPEVRYDPKVDKDFVLVSIEALAEAFFKGVDKFLIDVYSNKQSAKLADERFQLIVQTFPVQEDTANK
jgi:hypothetical protein